MIVKVSDEMLDKALEILRNMPRDLRCSKYCRSLNDSKGNCLKYNEKLEFVTGVTQSISGYIMCKECQKQKLRFYKNRRD